MRLTERTDGRMMDEHGNDWTPFTGRCNPILCRACREYTCNGFYRDSPAEYTVRCIGCVTVGYSIVDEDEQVGDWWTLNAAVNARIADEAPEALPADVRRIVAQVADMLQGEYLHSDHVSADSVRGRLALAV